MAATEVERLAILIEANTKSYERAMVKLQKDTQRAVGGASRSIKSLDGQLKMMAATAARFAGIAGIGFGLGALASSIQEVVKHAGVLVDTASKIGITTDQLQELSFAAQQTGVDFSDLSGALSFFSKSIGEASRGQGDLYAILQANNVSLRDQAGNLRSPIDLLRQYADLVMNAASAQERATLVTKAFGKSSDELINTLAGGSVGLQDLAAQAHRTGQIIDSDLLRKSEELGDRWDEFTGRLSTSFQTFVLTVVNGIGKVNEALGGLLTESSQFEKDGGLVGVVGRWFNGAGTSQGDIAKINHFGNTLLNLSNSARDKMAAQGVASAPPAMTGNGSTILPQAEEHLKAIKPAIEADTAALKELIATMDETRQSAREILGTFVDGLMAGKTLAESLGDALEQLGKKLLDSGLDMLITQLFGATGTASPGILGSLFGGAFADGGTLGAGKWGIAGERGPEIIRGPASITPMAAANANRPQTVYLVIDAHATPDLYLRVRQQAAKDTSGMIAGNNREQSRQRMRSG